VALADPRNSIAVVGLARVALDRGDEPGALDLARQALSIDPENAAAQRMVTRLGEATRERGEVVPEAEAMPDALVVPEAEVEPSPEQPPRPEPPTPAAEAVAAAAATPAVPPRRRSWLARLFRRST
jgi:outer membrane biosynthesis protein TonB